MDNDRSDGGNGKSLIPAPKTNIIPLRHRHDGLTPAARLIFLETLKNTGRIGQAAKAAGVSAQAMYLARKRWPDFGEAWAQALDDYRAGKPELRERHDGFSGKKRRVFLEALTKTGCVEDACKVAGVSDTTAYNARRKLPDFARAWNTALAMASTPVGILAFERATVGGEKQIIRDGKVVQIERKPSDTILRTIIMNTERAKERAADDEARAGEAAAARAWDERYAALNPREQAEARAAARRRLGYDMNREEEKRVKEELVVVLAARLAKLREHKLKQGYTLGPNGEFLRPGWKVVRDGT